MHYTLLNDIEENLFVKNTINGTIIQHKHGCTLEEAIQFANEISKINSGQDIAVIADKTYCEIGTRIVATERLDKGGESV